MTEAMIRKKPGMASVKDMPVLQDGPPPGGFAPVRYARRIPTKGPSAMALFLAAFGAFSYGMYQVGKGNKIRRFMSNNNYFYWYEFFRMSMTNQVSSRSNKWPYSETTAFRNLNVLPWILDFLGLEDVCREKKRDLALKEEKYAARRAILPMLQAEEDERFVKEWKKYLEYEAEVMKDVPGWKVGENVYNSGRWMPPASGELRPEVW
ncbi:hypothetical protein WN943_029386 [Citrus x changshan-huyou]